MKKRLIEGLPVIDAKHGLILTVRRNDILGSEKENPANCAVARAIKREYGSDVRVYLSRTYVKTGRVWGRFITPEAIAREITSFDRGAQFEPGEYILRPPSKTERLTHKPTGPKKNRTSRTVKARHVTASVREWRPK